MASIKVKRNDTFSKVIGIYDSSGNLIDTTGWTIWFSLRLATPPTSEIDDTGAVISKTFAGDSSGQFTLLLTAAEMNIDPENYLAEFQVKRIDASIASTETFIMNVQPDQVRIS